MFYRRATLLLAGSLWMAVACMAQGSAPATPSTEPNLTADQERDFLLTAKVVASIQLGKGITHPWRLTLSNGVLTHDAAFQSIDEHKASMQLADGTTELNFVDSYHYDIAGYELAT
jgi:hypothetical protein